MDKAGEIAESLRNEIENLGADFIDMVSYGNGKGVVVAKYPDQATMHAASQTAKQAFSKMIDAGVVDGDSVHPHMGEVFKSFWPQVTKNGQQPTHSGISVAELGELRIQQFIVEIAEAALT